MIRLHCKTMQNEREGKELSQYYLMLGMETCENIGAQNDDLYTMLVKSCAIFLHQIEEEATRLLQVPTLPQSQASARHTSRTAGDIHAELTGFGASSIDSRPNPYHDGASRGSRVSTTWSSTSTASS